MASAELGVNDFSSLPIPAPLQHDLAIYMRSALYTTRRLPPGSLQRFSELEKSLPRLHHLWAPDPGYGIVLWLHINRGSLHADFPNPSVSSGTEYRSTLHTIIADTASLR